MAFANGNITLSFQDILDKVSEEAILNYYTGISKIPSLIKSILREDKNPSMGIYYSTNGIAYRDFAKNEKGSMIDLLCKYLNLTYIELREKVLKDIDNIKKLDNYIISNNRIYKYDKETDNYKDENNKKITTHKTIDVTVRKFNQNDILYWTSQGISLKWLEFGNIYAISHIFIGDRCYTADKYAYVYIEWKDNIISKKVYQPFSKRLKWICDHDSSVWDLWVQVMNSKSKQLIITKSRKDALCIWENTGIASTSLQAEGFLPKGHVLDILKNKFGANNIYLLYDNDYDKEQNYGRTYGNKISKLYDIKQIEIPDKYQSKDASTLYKNVGKEEMIKIINELIK